MYITKCLQDHVDRFEPSLEDRLEADAMGVDPTVYPDENTVSLMLGDSVLALGGNQGDRVWFVTSNLVWNLSAPMKRDFRRLIIEYRDIMLNQYETVWNFVWVGNKSHIRFLKTIGAVFREEYTPDGQFQLFTIRR